MNCAIFIVYTKTNFLEDPLTSNNAKNRDSLNEETFTNAKLSGFLLYTEVIVNHSFLIYMTVPLKKMPFVVLLFIHKKGSAQSFKKYKAVTIYLE